MNNVVVNVIVVYDNVNIFKPGALAGGPGFLKSFS